MRSPMSQRTPPYHDTVLEFRTEPAFEIDLRQPVDPAALAHLRDAGLGHPFAVITACNPGGSQLCDEENALRTENLDARLREDRKSTRLNSSHVKISYAVFCLKKKKKTIEKPVTTN